MTSHYHKPFDPEYKTPDFGAFTVYYGTHPTSGETLYLLMQRAPSILTLPNGKEIVSDTQYGMPGGGLKFGTEDQPDQTERYKNAKTHLERRCEAINGTIEEVGEEIVYDDGSAVIADLSADQYTLEAYGQDGKTRWHGFSCKLTSEQMKDLLDFTRQLNGKNADGDLTAFSKERRDALVHASGIETLTLELLTAAEIKKRFEGTDSMGFNYAHERQVFFDFVNLDSARKVLPKISQIFGFKRREPVLPEAKLPSI